MASQSQYYTESAVRRLCSSSINKLYVLPKGAPSTDISTSHPRLDRITTSGPTLSSIVNDLSFTTCRMIHDDDDEDDLVTPCQGLLSKYSDFQSKGPAHFADNLAVYPKAAMGRLGALETASTGSEHTWQGSVISHIPSTITSPATSFEAEHSNSSHSNALPTSSLTGNKKTQYKKTKMCPWHRDGKCFMGTSCNYAHSREELRPKPDLSKTKICPELSKGKVCAHADCRFAHDYVELRATSAFFKTRICKFWQRGVCPAGPECRHAHGREDLRPTITALELPASRTMAHQPLSHSATSVLSNWNSERINNYSEVCVPMDIAPPSTSNIPSPSFLSTSASTPSPSAQPLGPTAGGSVARLAQALRQCAALLSENARPTVTSDEDGTSLDLLKTWIAQEVEKQVQIRQGGRKNSPSSSPVLSNKSAHGLCRPTATPECFEDTPLRSREIPHYLPSNLIQGLNLSPSRPLSVPIPVFNPLDHGFVSPKVEDLSRPCVVNNTPAFSNTIQGLFNNSSVSPRSPGFLPVDWIPGGAWHTTSQLGF